MTPDAKMAKKEEDADSNEEEEDIAAHEAMSCGSIMKVKAKRARLDKLVVDLSVQNQGAICSLDGATSSKF